MSMLYLCRILCFYVNFIDTVCWAHLYNILIWFWILFQSINYLLFFTIWKSIKMLENRIQVKFCTTSFNSLLQLHEKYGEFVFWVSHAFATTLCSYSCQLFCSIWCSPNLVKRFSDFKNDIKSICKDLFSSRTYQIKVK